MGFSYRAITANCANDVPGELACQTMGEYNLDFIVLHAQEVHFEKTSRQLKRLSRDGYMLQCLGEMPTHTQLKTQWHHQTGMATYLIHKREVRIEAVESCAVRRSNTRMKGSAYNKGGLICAVVLHKGEETIRVQTLNGHLDAYTEIARHQDWQNIYAALTRDATTWDALVAQLPHLQLSGYDANTRNILIGGVYQNPWEVSEYDGLSGIKIARLGGQLFSHPSTFQTENSRRIPDKHRIGCAVGGMLDFVAIEDGRATVHPQRSECIPLEKTTKRDHLMISSPPMTYDLLRDFDRVKNIVADQLGLFAPSLSDKLQALTQSHDAQQILLQAHQTYLSRNGIVVLRLALQHQKMVLCDVLKKRAGFHEVIPQCCQLIQPMRATGDASQDTLDTLMLNDVMMALRACQTNAGVLGALNVYQLLRQHPAYDPTLSRRLYAANQSIDGYSAHLGQGTKKNGLYAQKLYVANALVEGIVSAKTLEAITCNIQTVLQDNEAVLKACRHDYVILRLIRALKSLFTGIPFKSHGARLFDNLNQPQTEALRLNI